ncbi:glycosyltransferase family 4 protein [Natronococcus wangiae]|uniref:glycosyltransferase family 4 protein n=1 Tax=Natronococcus wangiae TaxID=3068275 RepID=UPI00273DE252|nr:glycosyltransferase family 4 protein [Natronococcus sp. AD5]
MKVLFVTHRYPPRAGGVETHVRELATRLVDRGHDVTVFSADAESGVERRRVENGVRIRRFASASPGDAFYASPQLALAVRRFGADVVHAHNYHAFPLFFAALGITDERFVVTTHYHGGSADGVRDALLSLYQPFGRWAVRRADDVIAVSDWERERLRADFGIDATVVPNGLRVDRFATANPERRDGPYLLSVGRLEEYKGVQHAIRALPELPEYELLVAGRGPYRTELKRLARETGVADRVTFLGFVDDDRLPQLYAGADAYVTLSAFEAYGMTVAEALAAGTPCVVRLAGALTDWADREGCVGVSDPSPTSVATRIRDAVDRDAGTAELADWDAVVDSLVARYGDAGSDDRR